MKLIFLFIVALSAQMLFADNRLHKPTYTMYLDIKKDDVILKIPIKCNKYLPTFGQFSEVCDDGVDLNNVRANTDLDGDLYFTDDGMWRDASKTKTMFLPDFNLENNQTIALIPINLSLIVNLVEKGFNTEADAIYPYLKSAKVNATLTKTIDDKKDTVGAWSVVITKQKPVLRIKLPVLDQGVWQTNTYDIDKTKECIDGRVWIKKYGAQSGDGCGWIKKK